MERENASRRLLGRAAAIAAGFGLLVLAVAIENPGSASTGQPSAVIFFTGAVQGYLDQCGCARNPLGGVDRRAAWLSAARQRWPRSPFVILDAGNFSDTPGAAGDVKTRGLVAAMGRLGYHVGGVSERELLLGVDHFRDVTRDAAFPFIASNLVRERDGATWLPAAKIVEAGELRVAVLSVTGFNPSLRHPLPGGQTLVTSDPVVALQSAIATYGTRADLVVVLSTLPLEDARQVARRVSGIDLIIGAHGGRLTSEPVLEGNTRILYAADEGKYLGQIEVYGGPRQGRPSVVCRMVPLGEDISPDRRMQEFMYEVLAQAQDAERLRMVSADPVGGASYVGAGACTPCHAEIVEQWSRTRHAQAFETLRRARKSEVSNCVPCHVTGRDRPGGFLDAKSTPHLLGVGCESCHGPAGPHLAAPQQPYGQTTLATCTSCHTAEMDPSFNYYQDRLLISHR
ncbi:MAG: hypothetical protein KBD01_13005 [Acidobacteria bacterium]|nr:hypothetical protein [Acidobacteriota bacterium]